MLLTIDVGNTHTVFGAFDGTRLVTHFRLSSDLHRTEDEIGVLVRGLFEDAGFALDGLDAVVIASVVPPLTEVMHRMCRNRLKISPLVVGPGVKTGMPVLYHNPKEVGADRIVNGVAAYERFRNTPDGPAGIIVVDLGTATTFDVVSPRGEYVGGAITPGVGTATEALYSAAAKLPRVELALPKTAVGKTTVTSMQSGILFGYAALVDGMVARMRGELDFAPRVIATGGLASLFATCCESIEEVDDFLTLDGLRIIHGRNVSGAKK